MASSLERARSLHEELEVLERSMYTELGDPSSVRLKRQDQIARDQVRTTGGDTALAGNPPGMRTAYVGPPRGVRRNGWLASALASTPSRTPCAPQVVASLLNAHRMRSAQLSGMYRDGDAERREEIAAMSGSDMDMAASAPASCCHPLLTSFLSLF